MKLNINFNYFYLLNDLYRSISDPIIEPLKDRFQVLVRYLKKKQEIPLEQIKLNNYEDLHLERIKNLCTRPLDLIDRSKRFTGGTSEAYSYHVTGCAMNFYAILFAFEDDFIDQKQNASSISDALRPNRTIIELLNNLEEGYQVLKNSQGQTGILYPVTLDNFTQIDTKLEQQFPGHCFIIQQLPPSKKNPEVSYRIYQSYLRHYTLAQFIQNHPKFLNLTHIEVLNFCKNIGLMLEKTVWDKELDYLYKENFLVSHPELNGTSLTYTDPKTRQELALMTLQFTTLDYYTDFRIMKNWDDRQKCIFPNSEVKTINLDVNSLENEIKLHSLYNKSAWPRPSSSEGNYYWHYRYMFPTYI